MDDRELLELAAKAAGMKFTVSTSWHDKGAYMANGEYWDPLTDDGDALRLAVKLRLHVDQHRSGAVSAWAFPPDGALDFEEDGYDPYASTRRAIVRAAAALAQKEQA